MANKIERIAAAAHAAQKRLEGHISYFEAACIDENDADMERYRAEAHAILTSILDAKAAAYQEALKEARNDDGWQ